MGRIFEAIERSDYLLLCNVQKCMEESGGDRAYLTEIAERMRLTVVETSGAVKILEDKGCVSRKMDENKERTYVMLTGKAKNSMDAQNRKMENAYRKITREISDEDLRLTVGTLKKIREIIKETETD